MADVKISALPAASTPLDGTELVPIVQGGVTEQVTVANLTAGRTVIAGSNVRSVGTGGSFASLNGNNVDGANIQLCRAGSGTQNAFLAQFQGSLFLKNLDSGFISFTTTTSDTERMRITSAGNVGIGTSAPADRLSIAAASGAVFTATNNATVNFLSGISGGNLGLVGTTSNHAVTFFANNTERMRIDASGNVGIGTSAPGSPLTVTNASADPLVALNATGTQNNAVTWLRSGVSHGAIYQENAGAFHIRNFTAQPSIFWTNNTERMRIDAAGSLLLGTTAQRTIAGQTPEFLIERAAAARSAIVRNTNDANGPVFFTAKSRGTANGSFAVVASGDALGTWNFTGSDGTADVIAASIRADVDGTPGTNDMPGRLVFATTADGASSPTERMRITSAGNVVAGGSVALATTATDGFLYVPTCAGVPTGTPTAITGMAPIVVNTTNNKLYFYSGGAWRDAGP